MSRIAIIPFVALAFTVLVPSVAWARPDDAKEPADLQGSWKLKSIEVGGESREPIGGGEPRWMVKEDAIHYGGTEIARLKADPSTTPKVIDLAFKEPERKYEGVYSVEKDTLSICLNRRDGATDRPGKFSTKDHPDWLMLVFEKDKTVPAKPLEGLTGFVGVMLAPGEDDEVVVNSPIEGSPAEKAGVKKDDVILKVGQVKATDLETTVKAVRDIKPGSKLDLTIQRDKKEMTISVTVGVLPFHYVVGLE
jgi:uncharacterized protein (TIGR03067 family)